MIFMKIHLLCAAVAALAISSPAQQAASSSIGFAFPAGGRQGSSFQVTVGGQFLDGVTNAFVSGAGVKAAVANYVKPLTPAQFNTLRDKFKALQERRVEAGKNWRRKQQGSSSRTNATNVTRTREDEKMLAELRKKLAAFQRRPTNPATAERVTLQVTVAPDAEPGERELRLQSRLGLSNPLVFCVGSLPEITEKRTEEPALPFRQQRQGETRAVAPNETTVTLPVTVNGTIMPGGVDRYRFTARKGQHLVAVASARELVPYLADAVPGWFQATLALYDADGRELSYNDDFRFHPDPVLHFEVPKDGTYVIEIKDAIYRGRDDFVYRLSMGELPVVTGVFPLGCAVSTTATFTVTGWNLPTNTVRMEKPANAPGTFALALTNAVGSGAFVVSADMLPECFETEPNSYPQSPQPVRLPMIINGRIGESGDVDAFSFEGRAGQELVVEVNARRLNSPLDSIIRLTDSRGGQLAFNDDFEDKGAGLETHHADSYFRAVLPTNGTYVVQIADAQHKGGPDFSYRMRISPPQPDFALRLVPSSNNARPGVWTPLTVYALRKDGFAGPINLSLKDAPAGFTLSGNVIPQGQDSVKMTLAPSAIAREQVVPARVEGRAKIGGADVVHSAVPADDRMQAFAYHHLVPAAELHIAVFGRVGARSVTKLMNETPVRIPAGGSARVKIAGAGPFLTDRFELALEDAPEGIALARVVPSPQGPELVIQADAAKAKTGARGNLIVGIFGGANPGGKAKKQANARRFAVGALPAIPYEIVAQQ